MWKSTAGKALAGVLALAVLSGCSFFKKKDQATGPQAGASSPAATSEPVGGGSNGSGTGAGTPAPVELAAPLAAVENFMAARMRGEPGMVGFDVAEGRMVDGTPTFVVRSYWRIANTAASVLTEAITVGGAKTYVITGVEERGEVSAYVKDGVIYRRDKAGERRVAALADLPERLRPREAAPGVEFGVSRDRVDVVSLSPDGQIVAFCTGGVHATLASVADTPPALAAPDIFPQSQCDAITWSPDAKWLAVSVRGPAPSHSLHVWQVSGWQARGVELPGQRPVLSRLHWEDGGFTFELNVEGRKSDHIYRPEFRKLEPWKPVGARG